MLTCKEVTHRASALIDGELGVWETFQIRLHLAMCKGCAAFIGQLRTTRELTGIAPPEPVDAEADGHISAILSRLHDETQQGG